jgi:hypothetical protein
VTFRKSVRAGSSGSGSVSTQAVANAIATTTAEAIASAVANATGNNAQVAHARAAYVATNSGWSAHAAVSDDSAIMTSGAEPAAHALGPWQHIPCWSLRQRRPPVPATYRLPSRLPSAARLVMPRSLVSVLLAPDEAEYFSSALHHVVLLSTPT